MKEIHTWSLCLVRPATSCSCFMYTSLSVSSQRRCQSTSSWALDRSKEDSRSMAIVSSFLYLDDKSRNNWIEERKQRREAIVDSPQPGAAPKSWQRTGRCGGIMLMPYMPAIITHMSDWVRLIPITGWLERVKKDVWIPTSCNFHSSFLHLLSGSQLFSYQYLTQFWKTILNTFLPFLPLSYPRPTGCKSFNFKLYCKMHQNIILKCTMSYKGWFSLVRESESVSKS